MISSGMARRVDVFFAQRDVRGLIFSKQYCGGAVSNLGSATNDNPVLGPMVMHLQAEAGLGLNLNAFDLESPAFVDAVVPPPRPMHLAVQGTVSDDRPLTGQRWLLHPDSGAVRDKNGIGGFDHDQILNADQADQPTGGVNERIATIGAEYIAVMGIPSRIFGKHLPNGIPGAQIIPTGSKRNHRNP